MRTYAISFTLFLTIASLYAFMEAPKTLTIAFGSCSKTTLPQPLWKPIIADKPDIWIWLGDNIYGDSDDTAVLRAKYNTQLANPEYQQLAAQTRIIGTWDDHDYGRNDGNKTFRIKKESQQIALDFLGEPQNTVRRKQEGIYTSYDYTIGTKKLKVILLDVRYHQDTLSRDKKGYIPNPKADILGEQQWKWLEAELKNSKADVHLIGSGLQFFPNEHATEMWGNYPSSLDHFTRLIATHRVKGVMLLTGDRHIGEFTKVMVPGVNYPIYEFTSSGMTHSSTQDTLNRNRLRIGNLVTQKHYGLLQFTEKDNTLEVTASLKGEQGQTYTTETVRISPTF
jgi:alkaline phosphatase D